MSKLTVIDIATICHEANAALCRALGDYSQKMWIEAPEWQRLSAKRGVEFRFENPDAPRSAQHLAWMTEKINDGWVYGPEKNAEAKTHPCLVPYDKLPPEQQAKDALFVSIVESMKPLLVGNPAAA